MIPYISNIIRSYSISLGKCNKEYHKEYIWSGSLLYTFRSRYYCTYNYRSHQHGDVYNYKSPDVVCCLPKNYLNEL